MFKSPSLGFNASLTFNYSEIESTLTSGGMLRHGSGRAEKQFQRQNAPKVLPRARSITFWVNLAVVTHFALGKLCDSDSNTAEFLIEIQHKRKQKRRVLANQLVHRCLYINMESENVSEPNQNFVSYEIRIFSHSQHI